MKRTPITPLYPNVRLNCTIVSDTHIDYTHRTPAYPQILLESAVIDAEENTVREDAFITIGDNTSNGIEKNWSMVAECYEGHDPADAILLAIGNHDTWGNDGNPSESFDLFYRYTEKICGFKRDKAYFSHVIHGYHLIFLGSEKDAGCAAYISDEQIEWFQKEMEEAGKSGKPIFVFCHQALNGRHGLPRTWGYPEEPDLPLKEGGIGASSETVAAILKQYPNTYYFSGHSHMGLSGEGWKEIDGYSTFEIEDGLRMINFPTTACGNHHCEDASQGIGMQLEVYDDRVVLRPRNYYDHEWTKVVIRDGKPYAEYML